MKKNDTGNDSFLHREIRSIVQNVIKSYGKTGRVDHIGARPIPSRESVVRILDDLYAIIYPGYFGEQNIQPSELQFIVGNRMLRLAHELSDQIAKSFRHECKRQHKKCDECRSRAQRETIKFLKKIPRLRKLLAMDVEAAYEGDPAAKSHEEIIFSYPGLRAVTIYRIAHELYIQGVPLLPRIMTEYAHSVTGIDIHPGAKIGHHFFIDHGTGVVIGETTEIGNNVRIYQGVTLGALSVPHGAGAGLLRGKKRHPTIKDDVIIYSGATLLGGNTVIGKGAVIGGNVWITESIPANTKVILETPKLRFKETSRKKRGKK